MGNAEATRQRILDAATAEFAAHGIAGARIDRIAQVAGANKNLIYVYFGGKDALFRKVLGLRLNDVYDRVPFTPEDLPGYAVRLLDFVLEHPEATRLVTWFGLEGTGEWPGEPSVTFSAKLKGIARAQRTGVVTKAFPPKFVLSLVLAIAQSWTDAMPLSGFIDPEAVQQRARLRKQVLEAVRRVCAGDRDVRNYRK